MKALLLSIILAVSGLGVAQAQEMPGLREGQSAPDFTAESYQGTTVRLSDYLKEGPVVLVFYRGAWCPYCNLHLQQFQSRIEDFNRYGASIIAISVDKPAKGAETVAEGNLDFQVIADSQAEILEAYELIFRVPDELAEKYKNEYGIDLEAHSGRTDHVIAIPATYVVAPSGEIVYAFANEDYKVRAEPELIIGALEAWQNQ